MKSLYLLPCTCGKKIEVDGGQAGLTARCSCGAEVPVPTMRGLAALERAEPPTAQSDRPSATWGTRQGVIFLGLVIVFAASVGGAYTWSKTPREKPEVVKDFRDIDRELIDQLTLEELWGEWHKYQTPLDDRGELAPMANFLYFEAEGWRWLKIWGGVLVFGLVVAALGLCIKPPGRAGAG
ncbi:MAG TPA: hypothetical protein VND64_01260 [Pirellulales bacterium]|nr:hypothetical protein [Pirellulales bacterium]